MESLYPSAREPASRRDSFCGCRPTIDAAENLGRDWIGVDVTQLAISLIKNRVQCTCGSRLKFVIGSQSESEGSRASRPPRSASSLNAPSASDKSSTRGSSHAPGAIGETPTTATGTGALANQEALPGTSLVRIAGEPTTPNEAAKPEPIIIEAK